MPNYAFMPSYQYGMPAYGMSYAQPQPVQYAQQMNSYAQNQQQTATGIIWVDGEVGAKAYQLPAGWAPNTPLPLWDTNDTIIYLKSTNPMGMPNPLQKIHYTMEDMPKGPMMQTSGTAALPAGDAHDRETGDFVTKDDLERMKQEIRETLTDAMSQAAQPAGSNGQTQTTATRKGAKAE